MKVSKKVGRRKRASSVSVSRRRLRNKKSKSGYRKKNAKTQRGGKRGRGYKRARTHKRGKRFHRGGVKNFDEQDNESSSTLGLESIISAPTLPTGSEANAVNFGPPPMPQGYDDFDSIPNAPSISTRPSVLTATAQQPMRELPSVLINPLNKNKELNIEKYPKKLYSVTLEYKKRLTIGGPQEGTFDVFIHFQRGVTLLRHDSDSLTKYDKMFDISIDNIEKTFNISLPQPIIDIQATNPYTGKSEGTYTFPVTPTNIESFRAIIHPNSSG
jgi:hypothetical protein